MDKPREQHQLVPKQAGWTEATKQGNKVPEPTTLITKYKEEHPHINVGLNKTVKTKEMQKMSIVKNREGE